MNLKPDPWILRNPELFTRGDLALNSASLAAYEAVLRDRKLPVTDDEAVEASEPYQAASRAAHVATWAFLEALAKDGAGRDLTVAELFKVLSHR